MDKREKLNAILKSLQDHGSRSLKDVASEVGISIDSARSYLALLIANGEVQRRKDVVRHPDGIHVSSHFTYMLGEARVYPEDAPEPEVVGAPYHNLRLTESLTGYEQSLWSFANLCMVTRK